MKKILAALLLSTSLAHAQSGTLDLATVNSSVTITTGNTFQSVLPAVALNGAARRSLTIQNNNASDSCWLFIGSAAPTKAVSILLLAGASYSRFYPYIPSDAIQATCAANSDTLYVETQ